MKKLFRDPIHNYIEVTDELIWDLINTKSFQRLNNIKQLGGAFQIFHGAMHTRFGHSLGAYHIAYEMLEKVDNLSATLSEREQRLLLVAALLHDLGHGPFSHAAEHFLQLHHEEMTCRLILEDEEIRTILDHVDDRFAQDVVLILQKKHPQPLLAQIVSSQVDVDRMDYLLRDSYYAGVPYGNFDKDRIIHVMQIRQGELVFKQSGMYAVEDFMLSRYHMRQQVYMNAKGRAFEILMWFLVRRFLILWDDGKLKYHSLYEKFKAFIEMDALVPVDVFTYFDDHTFLTIIKQLQEEDDEIISNLAGDLIHRYLPKAFEIHQESEYQEIKNAVDNLIANNDERSFYIFVERLEEQSIYYANSTFDEVKTIRQDGTIDSIEEVSTVTAALQEQLLEEKYFIFINQKYLAEKNESYRDVLLREGII